MRIFRRHRPSFSGKSLLLIFSVLLFSGCLPKNDTPTDLTSINLAPAPLPTYTPGTRYVYSNGSWEEVVRVDGQQVEWRTHRGSKRVNSVDFTRRSDQWETRKRKGSRNTESIIYPFGQQSRTLWPLQAGNHVSYEEEGRWQEKGGPIKQYTAFWRCNVKGTKQITVPAGAFDTWKIVCTRYKNEEKSISASSREYKTFYYAPSIGHWVRIIQEYQSSMDKMDRLKELVAIIPNLKHSLDAKANTMLKQTFQRALEHNKRNQAATWKRKRDKLTLETRPQASFWKEGRIPCRQYVQTITQAGNTQHFAGIACRTESGIWKIPKKS